MSDAEFVTPKAAPIIIAGRGNAARVTALSLAAAGLPVLIEPSLTDNSALQQPPDWQSVLALSPAAKTMFETLNLWSHLDCPTTPVLDMQVYGQPEDMHKQSLLPARLGFGLPLHDPSKGALPHEGQDAPTLSPLAHIVSLASLGRALMQGVNTAQSTGAIEKLPANIDDFDAAEGRVVLANGTNQELSLLVDSYRADPHWRQKQAARALRHDYRAAALVGTLCLARPHGHTARQIFLRDGPLAILPLPQTDRAALIWSLPIKKAQALAAVDAPIVLHELERATQGRLGKLHIDGALGVQKLELNLAQEMIGAHYVALGEATHVVHPLAGQGFNLTLRDAALLADTLYEARRLGLPFNDITWLEHFAQARRADAGITAGITHALARLFQGSLAPIGRFGLSLVGRATEQSPNWRAGFTRQADGGVSAFDLPRLMRGQKF